MDVTAVASGDQSSQAEPVESTQGSAKKEEARFPLRNDTILTFTRGFFASSKDNFSGWIQHPLATNGGYWNICLQVNGEPEGRIVFWWAFQAKEGDVNTLAHSLPRAFSYVICKEHHGVLAEGQIPWAAKVGPSNKFTRLSTKSIPFTVPADKTFFVYVSLSILTDQEIVAALQEWSIPIVPKALSTKCESDAQSQTTVKQLWNSRKGADLIVETADGKDIQAHKCILIVNSPVFEAMFAHDTLEKTSGRLKLNDLPYDVVYEMLQFFYVECVSSKDIDVLLDLLQVADRYDVPNLKDLCETLLLEELHYQPELGFTLLPVSKTLDLRNLNKHSELALMSHAFDSYVAMLHLAIDNSSELLWRYAAAMLYLFRCNVLEDKDWKKFEAAYPDTARALVTEYVRMDTNGSGRICAIARDDSDD